MGSNTMEGRVALVTGGASGIGRASAVAFAAKGARVVVSDRDAAGGEETVSLIRRTGGDCLFVPADVAVAREVEALVARAVHAFGRLDCAFNNAGIEGAQATTIEYEEKDWDRVLAVNLKGVWLCMKQEIVHMLEHGRGAIVNCASVAGLIGFPRLSAYVASKHGIVGLTKTTALEYAARGIRVNAVCPGAVQTPMIDRLVGAQPEMAAALVASEPIGRLGRPEEIAEAVLWLCSDAASFVTGQAWAVDGGWVAQ
jgi:NAD(P)-dependent dehydrogenase (short-subunit alcohol dehydrogenase family)